MDNNQAVQERATTGETSGLGGFDSFVYILLIIENCVERRKCFFS